MSDRLRTLLIGALLCTLPAVPVLVGAQSVDEWRERRRIADSTLSAAAAHLKELGLPSRLVTDGEIRAGGRVMRYRRSEITARDSSTFAQGFARGRETLLARFGDAGAALVDSSPLTLRRGRAGRFFGLVTLHAEGEYSGTGFLTPVSRQAVERYVLAQAGNRLVALTPALQQFAGWFALQPTWAPSSGLARQLAASWASVGRHCVAGSITACAMVIEPFDQQAAIDRYFEPRDYRLVLVSGQLKATSKTDSIFFASRRRCLDGADSACARIISQVVPADPFGKEIRGSLLSLAIELGGPESVARMTAAPNDEPIALLARASGLSEHALLATWQARTLRSAANRPAETVPIALSTLAWGALLLLAGTRRKIL